VAHDRQSGNRQGLSDHRDPSKAEASNDAGQLPMMEEALLMAPIGALARDATGIRPAEEGLGGDPDEGRSGARSVPRPGTRQEHAKAQASSDPLQTIVEFSLQALADERIEAPLGQARELRENAGMFTKQTPIGGAVQPGRAGDKLSPLDTVGCARSVLIVRHRTY
jgi:hypothetical protein